MSLLQHSSIFFPTPPEMGMNTPIMPSGAMGQTPRTLRNARTFGFGTSEDIFKAIIARIATDCSMADFKHVKTDNTRLGADGFAYQSSLYTPLSEIFNYRANTDQTSRAMIYDLVYSLLDEGGKLTPSAVALVPVSTLDVEPKTRDQDKHAKAIKEIDRAHQEAMVKYQELVEEDNLNNEMYQAQLQEWMAADQQYKQEKAAFDAGQNEPTEPMIDEETGEEIPQEEPQEPVPPQKPTKPKRLAPATPPEKPDYPELEIAYDVQPEDMIKGSLAVAGKYTHMIDQVRVGQVVGFYKNTVDVEVYNEDAGRRERVTLSKSDVAIIESPLGDILNRSNPYLKMLDNKYKLMNKIDKDNASGKLNGFIKLAHPLRTERRRELHEVRKASLAKELADNAYGIATLGADEEFVNLGGGIKTNVFDEIRELTQDYLNLLGITENVLSGKATAAEMQLYYTRAVDPVLQALVDAFNVSFFTKKQHAAGQRIMFYRDPFRLLSVESILSASDSLSRNGIYTPNEVRSFMGKPPSEDPIADRLFNRNIADANQAGGTMTAGQDPNMGSMGM